MITLEKLMVIAKAKFSDKSNLGDWYQKRLDICKDCPLNSAVNPPKSARETTIWLANLKKPSCYGCGCEIAAKASVREEECGLAKLKKEPLWKALPPLDNQVVDFRNYSISNLSTDKIEMEVTNELIFNYGEIKYNSDSVIQLMISDNGLQSKRMRIYSPCGCTTATPEKIGDSYKVKIEYDTKRLGNFDKSLTFVFITNKKQFQFKGKIKGTVIK